MTAGLQVDIAVARAAVEVRVAVGVSAGSCLAVLGGNGAGKSTFLSVVAGLLRPDRGTVRVGDRVLTDVDAGIHLPPERRRIGLMGQNPLLFPHLTALENVAFGPRSQGRARVEARNLAGEWLERLGLNGFADRKPRSLSGGQAQRVALARALAAGPDLLLLDEPLGALDVATVPEVRQVLRTHLREEGVTAVIVTHDVLDAAVIADSALVLDTGLVVDTGPIQDVLTAPRSVFGATLVGLNLIAGTTAHSAATGHPVTVDLPGGGTLQGLAGPDLRTGTAVAAVCAPSAVALHRVAPGGSPRNHWPSIVRLVQTGAGTVRVHLDGPVPLVAELTASAVAELGLAQGVTVTSVVKATEITVHAR